ncbi:MAG: LiaF-related protein [Lactobacillales bacterium]|jgi:predicted membrane protein|nr:LiaF-related protein [Lactobacillales bacterium]
MKKGNNILLGIIFIACAVLFLFGGQLHLNTWTIICAIAAVYIFVKGLIRLDWFKIALGLVIGLYAASGTILTVFNISLNLWQITVAVILVGIGLNFIFKPKYQFGKYVYFSSDKKTKKEDDGIVDAEFVEIETEESEHIGAKTYYSSDDEEVIEVKNRIGAITTYITSQAVREIHVESKIGAVEVHLENAGLKTGEAVLYADIKMGALELYVPKGWILKNQTDVAFGALDGIKSGDEGGNVLIIRGDVKLGAIDVKYI